MKAMLKKPSKEDKRTLPKQGGSCHGGVCQTLLEQNVRQKKKTKKNTWWFVVDTIPESVDETDDRPAGEALHFGMPLESHVRVREKVQTSLFRLTFHLPSYPR